jgi:hypothetical protein
MATESPGTSALRIPVPNHNAYETSPGEQMLLRSLSAENVGTLYPFLLNQRSMAGSNMADYNAGVHRAQSMQGLLGQQHLQHQDLENQRATALGLIKEGIPATAALSALALRGMPALTTPQDNANLVAAADQRNANLINATALQRTGSGLQSAAEGGVIVNPGQAATMDAGSLAALRSTTGAPLSLQTANARGSGKGDGDGTKVVATLPEGGGDITYRVTGSDPNAVMGRINDLQQIRTAQTEQQLARDRGSPSLARPGGAGAASATQSGRTTAPPASGASGGVPTAVIQAGARARDQVGEVKGYGRQGGRWYVDGTRGRMFVE